MKFYKLRSWYRDKMKYINEYIQFLPDLRDIKVVFITGLSMTLFFHDVERVLFICGYVTLKFMQASYSSKSKGGKAQQGFSTQLMKT